VCDGKDNDCNGTNQNPNPGIDDGVVPPAICATKGTCAGTVATCDGAQGFVCHYPSPPTELDVNGNLVSQESLCDGLDDDCDGAIDNGGATGSLVGQDWVDIGNNTQMMKWEASKPDADATTDGNVTSGTVCSKQTALPWTNITYPQALAACQSVGARLCTEQEWHRTCSVIAPT